MIERGGDEVHRRTRRLAAGFESRVGGCASPVKAGSNDGWMFTRRPAKRCTNAMRVRMRMKPASATMSGAWLVDGQAASAASKASRLGKIAMRDHHARLEFPEHARKCQAQLHRHDC